jgi:transcriptional regulator with XRE-family HTH domain
VCNVPTTPRVPQPRRQLGDELRRLRGDRTLADVADHLGWSQSKISRIENGKLGISDADLTQLVESYSPTEQERARIAALTSSPSRKTWWEPYSDALTDPYEAYIAAEERAASILAYEALVVPGLLQTAEYAKALIGSNDSLRDPDLISQRVQVRMARKAVLVREPEPAFHAVVDEAVLRRPVGGAELFRRQMLGLVEASQRPNIVLQVVPFDAGAHLGLTSGSFTLLEIEAGAGIVYSEGLTGGVIRTDLDDVRGYRDSLKSICEAALDREESRVLVSTIAEA